MILPLPAVYANTVPEPIYRGAKAPVEPLHAAQLFAIVADLLSLTDAC